MIHPLIKILVTRPELLADHLGAYAQLAAVEAEQAALAARRSVLFGVLALALGTVGVSVASIALMLAAALPLESMPAPWALWAVPGCLLMSAGVCAWLSRRQPWNAPFLELRRQWAIDAELMERAGHA